MQKARCHPPAGGLQLIVGIWFQVLFHSPLGVLFTFPSRYYYTIGYRGVFSLTPWSGQIPTGFLVSRSTRVSIQWSLKYFAYGPITLYGSTFQYFSTISQISYSTDDLQITPNKSHYTRCTTLAGLYMQSGLGSSRFARRY